MPLSKKEADVMLQFMETVLGALSRHQRRIRMLEETLADNGICVSRKDEDEKQDKELEKEMQSIKRRRILWDKE